ncbi:MAG: SufE family protein [Bacteroidia bacterium]|nr:SufE family protein [Bacteroidia bacterium]
MTIQEIQDEIVGEFEFFEDWSEKYGYIIELAKDLPPFPEEYRNPDHIVKGCQSQVWLHARPADHAIHFDGDSDAMIVKGLVSLLMRVFSDRTPEEILNADLNFIDRIGLSTHLSPTRSNGLAAMIKQIKLYALAYQAKEN